MIRVRKQIERLERGCMITVHLQPAQVTRQGCRIARHVHYLLGTQTWHLVDHVGGASARGIEDDHIPTRASAQQVTNACASRRADEASVGETGPCRVRLRVGNRGAILLDADEFSRLAGERETQVSRATVKFDYSLFFLYVTQSEQAAMSARLPGRFTCVNTPWLTVSVNPSTPRANEIVVSPHALRQPRPQSASPA